MWDQTTLEPLPGDDPHIAHAAMVLVEQPTRWRGSLIVGLLDGRPLGLAHLPRRSIWPFVLSVGFLLLFTAALLDHVWLALVGAVVSAVGIGGWFSPIDTEKLAIEEDRAKEHPLGTASANAPGLSLIVGSRHANGYWGTCVFVVILATALTTFLSGYFYLGDGPSPLPYGTSAPPLRYGLIATLTMVLAAAGTRWVTHSVDSGADRRRAVPIAITTALQVGFTVLCLASWREMSLTPSESGYASSVFGLIICQVSFSFLVIAMLGTALLWAVRSPADPRGRGVALNSSVVSYFAAASWLLILAAVYTWPRFT